MKPQEIDLDSEVPPLPVMRDGRSPFVKWLDGAGPRALPKYVYVASSWRNLLQQGVVHALRAARIDCYDYRQPVEGESGFRWSEIDPSWMGWKPEDWRKALSHPVAQHGFRRDLAAMSRADCCVLVLPCGRSAHLEAGYMAGACKPVFTLAVEQVEPELMALLLGPPEHICASVLELLGKLGVED
jgi:hypothetical protein